MGRGRGATPRTGARAGPGSGLGQEFVPRLQELAGWGQRTQPGLRVPRGYKSSRGRCCAPPQGRPAQDDFPSSVSLVIRSPFLLSESLSTWACHDWGTAGQAPAGGRCTPGPQEPPGTHAGWQAHLSGDALAQERGARWPLWGWEWEAEVSCRCRDGEVWRGTVAFLRWQEACGWDGGGTVQMLAERWEWGPTPLPVGRRCPVPL